MTENTRACSLGRHRCCPRSLAEAVHCVARHSVVETHRLAELLEVDYATFIRWTEPNGFSQLPGRKFAALAQHTGRFDHITWIGADAGLVVAPRVFGTSSADRVKELLDIAEQVGRLAATDRDAAADGISDDERRQLRTVLQRLCREASEYEQTLG